jgi:hypothetical protein
MFCSAGRDRLVSICHSVSHRYCIRSMQSGYLGCLVRVLKSVIIAAVDVCALIIECTCHDYYGNEG